MATELEKKLAEALQDAAWIAHVTGGNLHERTTFDKCENPVCKRWNALLAEFSGQESEDANPA